jgi:hypothetical protein
MLALGVPISGPNRLAARARLGSWISKLNFCTRPLRLSTSSHSTEGGSISGGSHSGSSPSFDSSVDDAVSPVEAGLALPTSPGPVGRSQESLSRPAPDHLSGPQDEVQQASGTEGAGRVGLSGSNTADNNTNASHSFSAAAAAVLSGKHGWWAQAVGVAAAALLAGLAAMLATGGLDGALGVACNWAGERVLAVLDKVRCAVLCCAVLCCAVLCCAVLCCAVLCCAVLAAAASTRQRSAKELALTILGDVAACKRTFISCFLYYSTAAAPLAPCTCTTPQLPQL